MPGGPRNSGLAYLRVQNWPDVSGPPYYFAIFFPLRVAEWEFTIGLFFDRQFLDKRKLMKRIAMGIVCS